MTLVRPNYVEYRDGQVNRIFCQVCGIDIAGMVDRPKGSGPNAEKLVAKFKRFPTYAEVKFRHSDGSFHVSNGCRKCMMQLTVPTAQEMYVADMAEMKMEADKTVVAVVAVDTSGSGLM